MVTKIISIRSGDTIVNRVTVPADWTGVPGQWSAPAGHTVEQGDIPIGSTWNGSGWDAPARARTQRARASKLEEALIAKGVVTREEIDAINGG